MSNIKNYIDNHDIFTTTDTTAGSVLTITDLTGTTAHIHDGTVWDNTVASAWTTYNDMKEVDLNINDDEDYVVERIGNKLNVKIVNAKEKHKKEFDSKMTEYIDE